jgi:hypothetical protein
MAVETALGNKQGGVGGRRSAGDGTCIRHDN